MKLCSRCNKRPAAIYINKIQGEKVTTEGLCLHCAREMKIKPFSDYMDQMGIKDDDIDVLEEHHADTVSYYPADNQEIYPPIMGMAGGIGDCGHQYLLHGRFYVLDP